MKLSEKTELAQNYVCKAVEHCEQKGYPITQTNVYRVLAMYGNKHTKKFVLSSLNHFAEVGKLIDHGIKSVKGKPTKHFEIVESES